MDTEAEAAQGRRASTDDGNQDGTAQMTSSTWCYRLIDSEVTLKPSTALTEAEMAAIFAQFQVETEESDDESEDISDEEFEMVTS